MLAAGRVITEERDGVVAEWCRRVGDRLTAASVISTPFIERQFALLIDLLAESVGPFRREIGPLWRRACEQYGRAASLRGLAAGEVVEELQHLREILTLRLAAAVVLLRPRQALSIMLRLNRMMDQGIATAVVGYTDALVATLFSQNGVPAPDTEQDGADVERQLAAVEQELADLQRRA